MSRYIAPIVEGDGEVPALPLLLRRIVAGLPIDHCEIRKPWRMPRSQIVKPAHLTPAINTLSRAVGNQTGGILVVLDQDDDDCTVKLKDEISASVPTSCKVEVVVAAREYEAWFLASLESLRGHVSVHDGAIFAGDPDAPRDAKGRLEHHMHEQYKENLHQAKFSSLIDLELAGNRSRSFRRLVSATRSLVAN